MSETTTLIIQTIFAGALGAAVGSFLNVVVLRMRANQPFLHGHSRCPHCGRQLRWWELVPVGSFLALGGRCRTCRHRLSAQYLLLECLTAAVFMTIFLRYGWSFLTPFGWVVGSTMLLIATYDGKWSLIPDEFSYLFIGSSLIWVLIAQQSWLETLYGLFAGAIFFGLQYVLSRGKWIGSGDIFIGLGLGLLLGWRMFFTALVMAYLSGAIVAAIQIIRRRKSVGTTMPFAPYLMAGGFAAWLFGPAIVNWYVLYVARF